MLRHLTNRQKVIIMIAVMSGLFLAALDQTIVGTALPKILSEFNALQELSWVVTAYLLTSTISVPIAGKMSDLYGRRKLLLVGITIFVIASLLCGTAQDISQLIAYRALQGIGGGILFANAFSVIGDLFSARERGKWQGIIGAVFGLSSLVGPLLGGYLTDGHSILGATTNWRWAFFVNVPVGLISFGLIAKYLPTIIAKKDEVVDYLGAALLSVGLGSLVLACSLGGTSVTVPWASSPVDLAWNSGWIIGMFVLAAASITGFIFAERKAKDPIIPLHLFRQPVFALVCSLMLLFGVGFFGAIIYIPTFAQQILHFSATNSGILLLPMILALTIGSIAIGQIVHKTGKYKMLAIVGLFIATIGIFTLSTLTQTSGYWDLAWRMAVTGIGLGMAMPIFNLAAQNAVEPKDLGVASSAVQLFRSIGGTVGLAVLGGIMNNVLTQKLSNIQSEPFVQFAKANGQGAMFEKFDINSLQGILSPAAQEAITKQLSAVPADMQHMALDAFGHLRNTLELALAGSLTQMFVISAAIMGVAFVASIFLKELPLRENDHELPPVEPA